jgi:ATP-dependent exoDNAse (exonuclease V) alpha subunit
MMIKEHDRVVLIANVPAEGLVAGDMGTVVHTYRDGQAYEVEFFTLEGKTAAVVTLEVSQVRPVGRREITHAHELTPR